MEAPLTATEIIEQFSQNIGCDEFKNVDAFAVHPETYNILLASDSVNKTGTPPTLWARRILVNKYAPKGVLQPIPKEIQS